MENAEENAEVVTEILANLLHLLVILDLKQAKAKLEISSKLLEEFKMSELQRMKTERAKDLPMSILIPKTL